MAPFRRALVVATALCCLAATGAPAVTQAAGAGAVDTPTVSVGNERVAVDGEALIPIELSSAPDGLSGYELTASVDDTSVVSVQDGEYPRTFGVTVEPEVSDSAVTMEAADSAGNVEPNSTSVLLAYVSVRGESVGDATVDVSVSDMDDDTGQDVDPATDSGSVVIYDNSGDDDDGGGGGGGGGGGDDSDEDDGSGGNDRDGGDGDYGGTDSSGETAADSADGTTTGGDDATTGGGESDVSDPDDEGGETDGADGARGAGGQTETLPEPNVSEDGVVTPIPVTDTAVDPTPAEAESDVAAETPTEPPTTTAQTPSSAGFPVLQAAAGVVVLVVGIVLSGVLWRVK